MEAVQVNFRKPSAQHRCEYTWCGHTDFRRPITWQAFGPSSCSQTPTFSSVQQKTVIPTLIWCLFELSMTLLIYKLLQIQPIVGQNHRLCAVCEPPKYVRLTPTHSCQQWWKSEISDFAAKTHNCVCRYVIRGDVQLEQRITWDCAAVNSKSTSLPLKVPNASCLSWMYVPEEISELVPNPHSLSPWQHSIFETRKITSLEVQMINQSGTVLSDTFTFNPLNCHSAVIFFK